jgi:spore coat protein H
MKPTILFLSLALAGLVTNAAEIKRGKRAETVAAFFARPEVLRIKIEIPPDGIATLSRQVWQFGPQTEREQVLATVREGKNIYTNVALHLKGAAGSFRPIDDTPAMTLNFDKHVKGQRFYGLEKLSLNNSVQDQTLVSEQLSRELFLQAGIPTPRATQAHVELNGRSLGMYVLVEGFNKDFLRQHFKDANGNLYDGGFLKDINARLDVNSGNAEDQSDRIALLEAVQEADLDKRLSRLSAVLDIDRFLTYVALDVMLWNWDGYPQNRNNWRLYRDPGTGKFVFIPHGMDQMFWKPVGSILPRMQGMVAKAALQIPELRGRYFERMKALRASVFQPEAMTNRAREIAARFRPVLEKENPERANEQAKALEKLCDAMVRRGRSLDEQLANPIAPIKFDESGMAPLAHWEAKKDFGRPVMNRDEGGGSESGTLRLSAVDGSSVGTWRSKVWLEPGRYRLEGRVKTKAIVPDPGDTRGGAGLRLARVRPEKYVAGSSDWQAVDHEFSVDDPLSEVQVLCEFRGASGEAAFESVRIRRLPKK